MSAPALMQWLGANLPEVQKQVRALNCPSDFYRFMHELTGVDGYGGHDAVCAMYLEALKEKHPTKPGPQVPPEIWNTRAFDAAVAWAATCAMCGSAS